MSGISKGRQRFIDLAKRVAMQSYYWAFRHGAVLVNKGGSVINTSCNKKQTCSFGARFRNINYGIATLHAEIGCILNLDRTLTEGGSIYVVRINRDMKFKNSRPCEMCLAAMKFTGIKKVYFTNEHGEIERIKL